MRSSAVRRDIQGLRALAVAAVVLFHAGFPLGGGFLGVDVFFVISGFVITAMLLREFASNGRVSLRQFYWRRFKRLTPALGVVVAVTVTLSVLILSPLGDLQRTALTGGGAMLLMANVVISLQTGSYFDAPAEANALLNTWSLSVEEQFYLVFPALLIAMLVVGRRRHVGGRLSVLAVGAVVAISLGFALAPIQGHGVPGFDVVTRFYSPATRAWEFGVGALGALLVASGFVLARRLAIATGLVGTVTIVGSMIMLGDPFSVPGPTTIVPVVGTLLVLVAGARPDAQLAFLSVRPVAVVGDWSYSIYLWHWPLIVFALALWPTVGWVAIAAATISVVVAYFQFRWIETPLRHRSRFTRAQRWQLLFYAAGIPLLLSVTVFFIAGRILEPRFSGADALPGDLGHRTRMQQMAEISFPCPFERVDDVFQVDEGIDRCMQSKPPGTSIDLAILGDSHAEHLYLGIAEALPDENVAYQYLFDWPRRTTDNSRLAFDQVVKDPNIRTVVLNSNWSGLEDSQALRSDVQRLADAGKKVLLTDDVPGFPFTAAACKYRPNLLQQRTCEAPGDPVTESPPARLAPVLSAIDGIGNADLIPTTKYFCSAGTCTMAPEGEVLFGDENHLNATGSKWLAAKALAEIESSSVGSGSANG